MADKDDTKASPWRPGARFAGPALLLLVLLLLFGLSFSSTGFYTIDEILYYLMAQDFWNEAGFLEYYRGLDLPPDLLRPYLFIERNGEWLSQYPGGYALLAAPAFGLLGARGLVLLNLLAFAGLCAITYRLAVFLCDRRTAASALVILIACGFLLEYAVGIWPHAIACFFVALASYCWLKATYGKERADTWLLLAAGAALGLGMNIRVDVVLALPALLLWVAFGERATLRPALWLAVGLLPGLLLASFINQQKFGSWLPIDYGREGPHGSTSLLHYKDLLAAAAAAGCVYLLLHVRKVRLLLLAYKGPAIVLLTLATLVSLIALNELALRMLSGYLALLVDMNLYSKPLVPLEEHSPGGILMVNGVFKKALLQSLPFLPIILACAAVKGTPPGRRAAAGFACLFLLTWTAPFAFSQWHGGVANNMRYLTPTLFILSIASGAGWSSLRERAGEVRFLHLSILCLLTFLLWIFLAFAPGQRGVALWASSQIPLYLAGLLVFGLLLLWRFPGISRPAARSCIAVALAAFSWAAATGLFHDLLLSQYSRFLQEERRAAL
jgi:4-amino-4-deoxy-L-arabinose transferase-like glycosyltransferase